MPKDQFGRPGLSREGHQWAQALGNQLRRQINTAFGQTHRDGTSAILDAATAALQRGSGLGTHGPGPGGRLGMGWVRELRVEKPERAGVPA